VTAAPTRAARAATHRAPLVEVFRERAWARAFLWREGELDFHDAIDQLQHDAVRDGLVKEIGQDAVQQILAAAFRPHREGEP
jgi:hypothetical protein